MLDTRPSRMGAELHGILASRAPCWFMESCLLVVGMPLFSRRIAVSTAALLHFPFVVYSRLLNLFIFYKFTVITHCQDYRMMVES